MTGGRTEAGIMGVKDMVGAGGNIYHRPAGGGGEGVGMRDESGGGL